MCVYVQTKQQTQSESVLQAWAVPNKQNTHTHTHTHTHIMSKYFWFEAGVRVRVIQKQMCTQIRLSRSIFQCVPSETQATHRLCTHASFIFQMRMGLIEIDFHWVNYFLLLHDGRSQRGARSDLPSYFRSQSFLRLLE